MSNASKTVEQDIVYEISDETVINRRVVYKYHLKYGINTIEIPRFWSVLKFGLDENHNELTVWISINPNDIPQDRLKLNVIFTGEEYDGLEYPNYLGTLSRSGLVYHCFWKVLNGSV